MVEYITVNGEPVVYYDDRPGGLGGHPLLWVFTSRKSCGGNFPAIAGTLDGAYFAILPGGSEQGPMTPPLDSFDAALATLNLLHGG